MAKKDELLKTINDAFAELANDFDDQSDGYKISFDPFDPPQVEREKPGKPRPIFSLERK